MSKFILILGQIDEYRQRDLLVRSILINNRSKYNNLQCINITS